MCGISNHILYIPCFKVYTVCVGSVIVSPFAGGGEYVMKVMWILYATKQGH